MTKDLHPPPQPTRFSILRATLTSVWRIYLKSGQLKKMEVSHNESQDSTLQKESRCLEEFECDFCDDVFKTKGYLMKHNKKEHEDRLAQCWKFAACACHYGNHCWFNHPKINLDQEPEEIKCTICENKFTTKSELHTHNKKHHKRSIPICRNASNGKCRYGDLRCWFIHDDGAEAATKLLQRC